MKKNTILFFGIFCMLSVASAQDLTFFDFDGVSPVFSSSGDTFVSVANPHPDAVNGSANVGLYSMWMLGIVLTLLLILIQRFILHSK